MIPSRVARAQNIEDSEFALTRFDKLDMAREAFPKGFDDDDDDNDS